MRVASSLADAERPEPARGGDVQSANEKDEEMRHPTEVMGLLTPAVSMSGGVLPRCEIGVDHRFL